MKTLSRIVRIIKMLRSRIVDIEQRQNDIEYQQELINEKIAHTLCRYEDLVKYNEPLRLTETINEFTHQRTLQFEKEY